MIHCLVCVRLSERKKINREMSNLPKRWLRRRSPVNYPAVKRSRQADTWSPPPWTSGSFQSSRLALSCPSLHTLKTFLHPVRPSIGPRAVSYYRLWEAWLNNFTPGLCFLSKLLRCGSTVAAMSPDNVNQKQNKWMWWLNISLYNQCETICEPFTF